MYNSSNSIKREQLECFEKGLINSRKIYNPGFQKKSADKDLKIEVIKPLIDEHEFKGLKQSASNERHENKEKTSLYKS